MEGSYERINEYSAVKISLASPQVIRSWSYGEVKKPETINYRTYRPEKDGLFCERIFGPERDWECACGKYKGIKHKGIICDRCGVKVTHSRVRRKRMGHITLAAPVVHIWFFKAMPNRLGNLLDMKSTSMERVVYFQDYVVIDPGETPLKRQQLLTDDEYRLAVEKYGDKAFKAGMGAEAIRELVQQLDLKSLAVEMREDLGKTKSKQKAKKLIKRLKIVEDILGSENSPDWMILEVVPVIPPDLRPLVLLDSGNFATSDLNDLYRRVINRNNRLKRLIELNAPEVIIRNEKRMLQQAVDALFDNGRCKRPVLGSSNRALKSLTDMIKGKQGRFRENLLGKRVDYSARSVIVVGPELKLNQCGLPKKIALELYQPFIIRRLKELGYADTIKSAKKMLEHKEEEVWDILEEVIQNHPVLLNRAPTLHRMGIQAFQPVLVEGNAIHLHPLVCRGFNADFDGDQMAVHLPLSIEAQIEARTLMMSTQNIFSPASGSPIIAPSQDMVLGMYFLTAEVDGEAGEGKLFYGPEEMLMAYDNGKLSLHAKVKTRLSDTRKVKQKSGELTRGDNLFVTTAGRVILNDILPEGMPFYNYTMDQRAISGVIHDCYLMVGRWATIKLLDDVKALGFKEATKAGISIASVDMRIPDEKFTIIEQTNKEVEKIQKLYEKGAITEGERYNQVIDAWTHARELVGEAMMRGLKNDTRDGKPYLNPIFIMSSSGARGSADQIRQLAGMRGLMAKPSGKIIETPILANFREGLSVLEYFSSTHGARKGLADTAIKTADSGYLTRKLVDVTQNLVTAEIDCGTAEGVTKSVIYKGEKVEISLAEAIVGRTARDSIVNLVTDEIIVAENELITPDRAAKIEELGYEKVRVRSPLTCESRVGICVKCYGMDLARGAVVEEGLAVGVIAAQSIGEPGTQLTLRTFHIGGTASRSVAESQAKAGRGGTVVFHNLRVVENQEGQQVVLNRNGEVRIVDAKGRELEAHGVPAGAVMRVIENDSVKNGAVLCSWDPHNIPILAEMAGRVRFDEIVEGETMREEVDAGSGVRRKVIVEHKGDLHPQVIIESLGEGGSGRKDDDEAIRAFFFGSDLTSMDYIVTEDDGELTNQDLKALEQALIGYYFPEWNIQGKTTKGEEEGKLTRAKALKHLHGDKRLIGYFSAVAKLKWRDCSTTEARKTIVEEAPKQQGIYLFRSAKAKSLKVGYIGLSGLGAVQRLNIRLKFHLLGGGASSLFDQMKRKYVAEHAREESSGKILGLYPVPERANIEVDHGAIITPGTILAKVPREATGTQDITGGLPRVTELFEARRPKEPAIISEIDGIVELRDAKRRGKRTLVVRSDSGMEREHLVPHGRHLRVHTGDRVKAGEALVEGPLVLQDILRIAGEEEVENYLLREVQNVYRSQNVKINDKHIEVIVSRMLRRVLVDNPGDTKFLPGAMADKFDLRDQNDAVRAKGGKPGTARPQLLGITKASLLSDSFISAASFQETTKVLTEAALGGRIDTLQGLKENVILGHLIPAGTGFPLYHNSSVKRAMVAVEAEKPEEDTHESELDRRFAEEARKQRS